MSHHGTHLPQLSASPVSERECKATKWSDPGQGVRKSRIPGCLDSRGLCKENSKAASCRAAWAVTVTFSRGSGVGEN